MDLRNLVLTTERLRLAAFRPADAPDIFAAVTPRVTRYMSFDPEPSLAAFGRVWPDWLTRMEAGAELFLVLRLADGDGFIGVAGLHGVGTGEPEAGLWIKESGQRLGYGREAVAAMIDWAAGEQGATGVLWPVVEANLPSRRLAERLGGRIVGARRLRKGAIEHPEVIYRIPAPAKTFFASGGP